MTFNLDFCQINQMRKNFFCLSSGNVKVTWDKALCPPHPGPSPTFRCCCCCDSIKKPGSEFHKYFQLGFFPPRRLFGPKKLGTRAFAETTKINFGGKFEFSELVKQKIERPESIGGAKIGQDSGDRKIRSDSFAHKLLVADLRPGCRVWGSPARPMTVL